MTFGEARADATAIVSAAGARFTAEWLASRVAGGLTIEEARAEVEASAAATKGVVDRAIAKLTVVIYESACGIPPATHRVSARWLQ